MDKISGFGSIFYRKSRKRWVVQYTLDSNGKKQRKCIYTKTKEEAHERLNQLMYEYHNDLYIRERGIPLIRILKQNREDKYSANLISESHYSRLEFVIKEIDNSNIGKMNIDKITTRDLQDYFNSLIDRYTDSTIKKIWDCIKQGFEIAFEERYILENPFKKVLKPKSKKPTKVLNALSLEDENKLASYLLHSNISDEKYKNVILVELYTGMRIGEVLSLSSTDIDFNRNIIHVNKTITVNKDGELIIKSGTKTYAGLRDIPISPIIKEPLKEQVEISKNNKDYLLFTFENRLIKASTINTVLKRICNQLKLSNTISNHTLRHTFGTRCIEAGMQPKVVQTLMGHKDIAVTLNTYTSVLERFKSDEFNKVAQYYLNNSANLLPEVFLNNDYYVVEDAEEDYIIDDIIDPYAPYKFSDDQIINLFGNKETFQKEIIKSIKDIYNWNKKEAIK